MTGLADGGAEKASEVTAFRCAAGDEFGNLISLFHARESENVSRLAVGIAVLVHRRTRRIAHGGGDVGRQRGCVGCERSTCNQRRARKRHHPFPCHEYPPFCRSI